MLSNVDKMIGHVPQPQMLGGKRERKYVLPGHSEYDYAERSLAVGGNPDRTLWDDEGGNDEELGGKLSKQFWRDFGHGFKQGFTKTMEVGMPLVMGMGRKKLSGQTLHQHGGAVWEDDEGMVHSTPRRRGGKANKVVNTFKKIGKALKPVVQELKPVAKKFVKEVVIPEGIKMAKSYLAGPSADVPVTASGRRRRRKPVEYESESDEEGGALIMNHPKQFHSKSYPKGLASYNPKGGKRGGSARGAIVSKVMREKGMSLPEASRYVKEKGLYKP